MRRLLISLALILTACGDPAPSGDAVTQGFAGLGGDADDFAQVDPSQTLQFPDDHAAHPEHRIEWWYATANLRDQHGRRYGIQWTLFRQALTPEAQLGDWQDGQVWMAHVGLTTAENHWQGERFGRSGGGQAGVMTEPFYQVWLDDWSLTEVRPPSAEASGRQGDWLSHIRLQADTDDFAYDLVLQTDQALVLHGDDGFSVKSERGQASWYYSQPFFQVNGKISLPDGEQVTVHGDGWLDREWSSQPLAPEQQGWDWFSLQLDSGERVMLFRLREDGDDESFRSGTWIDTSGEATPLTPEQIDMTPTETTQVAGRTVPVGWQLRLPDFGLDIETRPLNPQSWMDTSIPYWEGPIDFSGSHTGRGYLEMTGY